MRNERRDALPDPGNALYYELSRVEISPASAGRWSRTDAELCSCHVARDLRTAGGNSPHSRALSDGQDFEAGGGPPAGGLADSAGRDSDRSLRLQPPQRPGRGDFARGSLRFGRGCGVCQRVQLPWGQGSAPSQRAGAFPVRGDLGYVGGSGRGASARTEDAGHHQRRRLHHGL